MYTYSITNTVSKTVVLWYPIRILTALQCYIRLFGLNQYCKDRLQEKNFLSNIVAQVLTSM